MHGFTARAEVRTALAWIDAHAYRLANERVAVDAAADRVLAQQVIAPLDVPAFDRAAMDGYALHGALTTGATEYTPLEFTVVGQVLAGQAYAGEVRPGTAVRIMTGAALPSGADAVVPAEYARLVGTQVEVSVAVPPGRHVGRRGEDIRAGPRGATGAGDVGAVIGWPANLGVIERRFTDAFQAVERR